MKNIWNVRFDRGEYSGWESFLNESEAVAFGAAKRLQGYRIKIWNNDQAITEAVVNRAQTESRLAVIRGMING